MKFFEWERPVDLSRFASMTSAQIQAEVDNKQGEIDTKWVRD